MVNGWDLQEQARQESTDRGSGNWRNGVFHNSLITAKPDHECVCACPYTPGQRFIPDQPPIWPWMGAR